MAISVMKKNWIKRLNFIFWFALAVFLMITAHTEWSKHGVYTLGDFFASLVFHAAPCGLFWFMIDEWLENRVCK